MKRANGSLPTRERGLKCFIFLKVHIRTKSLPTRERGLKCVVKCYPGCAVMSLPTRERGLKYLRSLMLCSTRGCRSPRGSVD